MKYPAMKYCTENNYPSLNLIYKKSNERYWQAVIRKASFCTIITLSWRYKIMFFPFALNLDNFVKQTNLLKIDILSSVYCRSLKCLHARCFQLTVFQHSCDVNPSKVLKASKNGWLSLTASRRLYTCLVLARVANASY